MVDAEGALYLADLAKAMRFPRSIRGTRMELFDFAHLARALRKLLDRRSTRDLIFGHTGDREFTRRVLRTADRYGARKKLQHRRLRTEFYLRQLAARARYGRFEPARF